MNEKIEKARKAALDLLKPSKKDLKHGLDLHANTLVCESYGFSPGTAMNGDIYKATIEKGATTRELQDLGEFMHMTRQTHDPVELADYKEAWEASGVDCIFQNAGEEEQTALDILKRHANFTYATDMLRDYVRRAATPDDIKQAWKDKKRSLYFTSNCVPVAQEWSSVEEELRYIHMFFLLGCRMMHLTYNRRNMIGDGCIEPANGGLSDFGRAVVKEMNKVGVIVDVAHSGWRTSIEAAQVSDQPITASHTVCCAVNMHPRGKPDEVIRAIVDKGGVIGICCVPGFLGGTGDIRSFLNHIDHLAKTVGTDYIAIGTDVGSSPIEREEAEWKKLPAHPKARKVWRSLWNPDDPLFDPAWQKEEMRLSMAWTNWPLFTVGLVQRGYSDNDIQKIVGGNILRMARVVFDAREKERTI